MILQKNLREINLSAKLTCVFQKCCIVYCDRLNAEPDELSVFARSGNQP